ncbi:hypothetical protein, partial [Pseudomonas protegens]|uniref:hypothetical protein n=1 Tax=Pseudomonas protegens TaxID=380021 RepID=UPI0035A59EC7
VLANLSPEKPPGNKKPRIKRGCLHPALPSLRQRPGEKHLIAGHRHRRLSLADNCARRFNLCFECSLTATHQVVDWELIPVVFNISKTPHTQLPPTTDQYRQAPDCLENTARHGNSD